ncbi:MAG: hypothetical protein U5J82_00565 [Desulfobacterales bacterium]|nr:hypothetical protein [Desulfobacterales bacterium]
MDIEAKLTLLADAAKYDVSCASSGSRRTASRPHEDLVQPKETMLPLSADGHPRPVKEAK